MRILFAGGGTAGHINPALSIAAYAKKMDSETQVLFIGKAGNMEETLVPKAGYDIEFIDIAGFTRSLSLKNIAVILKTIKATGDCKRLIREFKPDVVVCTGGYVSGPVMKAAYACGVPSIIHEQNVFPGVTVKLSQRYASYLGDELCRYKKSSKAQRQMCFYGESGA